MTSAPAYTNSPVSSPGQKNYNAPGVSNLPYNQRPLPPGWISQFDSIHQANFYVDERTNPPTITWEDPRPAYYMAQERGQYAPPPPGIQGRSPQPQQQNMQQQQTIQTVNSDGSITTTTITSNGQQPIHITQTVPPQQQQQQQPQQQQQQQQQSSGRGVGRAIVGAAVVSSMLRPRPVVVAPRRRRF
ncbi:hypothetical protein MVEG_04283 [Podila verticillata NRRL 6337]|nr:hypothetical protein MVEG_04283 [Podila verticillata NRRL 6337]